MIFETGLDRFQPDEKYMSANYLLDQQFLALIVGMVALGLPFVMLAAASRDAVCFYDSISHFYYAQFFGDVLVAALVFIGTFLLAYRGESQRESTLANFAGFCAFGVALLLPNKVPGTWSRHLESAKPSLGAQASSLLRGREGVEEMDPTRPRSWRS